MEAYYDKDVDIFCVHKGFAKDERFKENLVAGDVVLDISTRGRVRGVEVLHASAFFRSLGVDERQLLALVQADFTTAKLDPASCSISLFIHVNATQARKSRSLFE